MKLHKKLIITGRMTLLTGLHIGDSKDNVEIGGVDNPVVRRKDNNEPYIPGSSLKGKLRSLLEVALGENADTLFKNYQTDTGRVLAALFGSAANDGTPSRILVRDASLTREWAKLLYDSEFTDMPYTEVKFENRIDRIKGTAEHPRQTERIPAGAEFEVQFVVNIVTNLKKGDDKSTEAYAVREEAEAKKTEQDFLALLQAGIRLLEDDYLGGSGSRGYGQVKFDFNGWGSLKDGKGVVRKLASEYLEKSNKPTLA